MDGGPERGRVRVHGFLQAACPPARAGKLWHGTCRGAARSLLDALGVFPDAESKHVDFAVELEQPLPKTMVTDVKPLADGALKMLPLVHGERQLGALWIDGEATALGQALLDDVAVRAAIAFATARLYRNLQRELAERRQAEARLEESSRRKDEFLAMLSHELRNPLAPIRNAVEVIRLSPILLNGDSTRLAQVINNLLTNATKYTPEGGAIAVLVERGLDAHGGDCAVLTVSDDGVGIEPERLPHVFELFEQGKRALDRTQGGLGVGLTLVQRLVKLHGGGVEAASPGAGQGARFRVTLPCLHETDATRPADEDVERLPAARVKRRVLVVDDNPDVVETTSTLLALAGHDVRSAKDGLQALQVASEWTPEVVLLDIGLPLMDGYQVACRLRRIPQTSAALLVALKGYGQQGDRQRGREAGFDGHLLKPVDPHSLGRMIDR